MPALAVSYSLQTDIKREPEIQPCRVVDELGEIAIASIKRVSERRHPGRILGTLAPATPQIAQLDCAVSPHSPDELVWRDEGAFRAVARYAVIDACFRVLISITNRYFAWPLRA